MAEIQSFLTIEESLCERLRSSWVKTSGRAALRDLGAAITVSDWSEAERVASSIRLDFTQDRGEIKALAVGAFMLGQSFFTGGRVGAGDVASGAVPLPMEVDLATDALVSVLENRGGQHTRAAALSVVADAQLPKEERTVLKAVIAGLGTKLNAVVAGTARSAIDVNANLTTSRLVSYGALSQASALGVKRFQIKQTMPSATLLAI